MGVYVSPLTASHPRLHATSLQQEHVGDQLSEHPPMTPDSLVVVEESECYLRLEK